MDNLSLKYRPQTYEDIVGQKETLAGLRNYLSKAGNPQSLLFTGPRGTGKTTTSRLVTKTLNCQAEEGRPCGQCTVCVEVAGGDFVDLYELDGATNRGIDAVRQIIDLAYHSPVHQYKIFIIDEAHMLTREASNALLKILEEPPHGVLFVLCTTEEHKILPTIKSRLKIYRFRLIESGMVKAHLKHICSAEDIKVSEEILDFIVVEGGGSMRDSIKTLDQVRELGPEATLEMVLENVGLASFEKVADFVSKLIIKDLVGAFGVIDVINRTSDIPLFYQQLMDYYQLLLYATLKLDVGQAHTPTVNSHAEKITDEWVLSTLELLLKWNRNIRPMNRLALEAATVEIIKMGQTPKVKTAPESPQKTAQEPKETEHSTMSFIRRRVEENQVTVAAKESQF